MQTTQNISLSQLHDLVKAIYEEGVPVVKEAYSAFDTPARWFKTGDDLLKDLTYSPSRDVTFFHYSIYYPESAGYTFEERIDLNPEKCNGHTYRFSQAGWGLIFLQCNFQNYPIIECRIAVNSLKRAEKWSSTYPEFQSPEAWNWKIVGRHAGKLVRRLREYGKQIEQMAPDGGQKRRP